MAEGRISRRLAAILDTDMVGYSRLMGGDEAGTIARQKAHRNELIDPKIAEYNGRIVKSSGDGLLVEFSSAVDAVSCAVEVQRAMQEREADVPPDRRIAYRVGINLGEIVVDGDDILGDGVNIAARLQALAEPGGIRISDIVFRNVKGKLDLGFADLGPQKVKNIAEPVRTYKVLLAPADAGKMTSPRAEGVARRFWVGAVAVTVLVLAAAGLVWWSPWALKTGPEQTAKAPIPLPKKPSIAILPFTDMSGDKTQQYFADGIAEDLITDLSKISGLFVIARHSSFVYRGSSVDVRKIGRELGVRYIVEGSVRKAGGRVRINAQLVDATDGRHVWAERYDGEFTDIFGVQDRVTRQIVKALSVHLEASVAGRASNPETQNATAYDAFLQGWSRYQRGSAEDLRTAISLFERAVDLDPDYARAHGALALALWRADKFYWFKRGWRPGQAEQRLELALRKPTAQAHYLASWMALERGRHEAAIDHARRALAIEPNSAESHAAMANALVFSGDPKGAISYIRQAMRLDPHFPADYLRILGLAEFGLSRFEAAAALFEQALKRNPEDWLPSLALAASYGHLDRKAESAAALKTYSEHFPDFQPTTNPVSAMVPWPFREPSDAERFGAGLLKAGMCCRRDLDSLVASLRASKQKRKQ